MKIKVVEPIKVNSREWDIIEYEKDEEFPESEGRHSDLCVVCGFPSYPECMKWCPNQELNTKKS